MSCLPFAAWAAKKAAQIVGGSGSSSSNGLPVVELTSVDGDSVTLSESDSAKLTAVLPMPFIMSMSADGGTLNLVMSCMSMGEYGAYYSGYMIVPFLGEFKVTLTYEASAGIWIYYQVQTEV